LRLRVVPGADRTGVVGRHGAAWKVRVSAPPERGRANDAVLDLLSDTLSLPRASVSLVSGPALGTRSPTAPLSANAFRSASVRPGIATTGICSGSA
jgi:hypothetical protein